MLVNSLEFFLFLPIVSGLFWLIGGKSMMAQNILIEFASDMFYRWCNCGFLSLILFSFLDFKKIKNTKIKFEVRVFIKYRKNNYNIDRKIFVFKSNSDKNIINIFKSVGYNTILLDSSKDKSWSFDHDLYWTCYGHKRVASQIKERLEHDFSYLIN